MLRKGRKKKYISTLKVTFGVYTLTSLTGPTEYARARSGVEGKKKGEKVITQHSAQFPTLAASKRKSFE
jgi:hypothetical protein